MLDILGVKSYLIVAMTIDRAKQIILEELAWLVYLGEYDHFPGEAEKESINIPRPVAPGEHRKARTFRGRGREERKT